MKQKRWKDAEDLLAQVVEARQRLLGVNRLSTVVSLHLLAQSFFGKGRFNAAEKLLIQALRSYMELMGEGHPHTLESKRILSLINYP
ncbi:hypothetical protein GQ44DRAFT_806580 [Phaeosphaeriaceae sp. PMI808]|nr:hypothetical protein GQ44DRAFT_806580 [Phaeosphaeriaceae sp. PMI808]